MAKTVNTGWKLVTPGACKNCGNDSDYGCDGRGNVLCSCHPEFDESFDTTEAEPRDPITDPKILALAAHLKVDPYSITEEGNGDWYECEEESGEYLVLTDSEADQRASESLDSYIEDMTHDWPETAKDYFDAERWKRDALLSDGRGHVIASYDSNEGEEQIDGEWYFIYRMG